MKKWFCVLLSALLLCACLPASAQEAAPVRVIALKGPTAMAIVKMMSEAEESAWQFEIAPAVDEVSPRLLQGTVDTPAVPANLASVLYNRTEGGVRVLAVNTLGVLYIVESGDSVESVADLRGRTI